MMTLEVKFKYDLNGEGSKITTEVDLEAHKADKLSAKYAETFAELSARFCIEYLKHGDTMIEV